MTELTPFVFLAKYVKAYDADTVTLNIDLGFNMWRINQSVRIVGIDTPEMRPKKAGRTKESIANEKKRAQAAAVYARELLKSADRLYVRSHELDKYGRLLGIVYLQKDGELTSLGDLLINAGHAVDYDGGTKAKDWGA